MDLANQLCLDRHLRNHTVFPAVFLPALVVHIYLFFPSLETLLLKRCVFGSSRHCLGVLSCGGMSR